MTHRSHAQEHEGVSPNERLEFLGDAVLGMIVTDELIRRFARSSEGELTRVKSQIVSRQALARKARHLRLGDCLLLSDAEDRSGGRDRNSILSDAMEALIGAVYLDGGLEASRRFIIRHIMRDPVKLLDSKYHHNYKSWLLEAVQGKGNSGPRYRVIEERGPDHQKEFIVDVHVNGKLMGQGRGLSKKQAEQEAARAAVQNLGLDASGSESG